MTVFHMIIRCSGQILKTTQWFSEIQKTTIDRSLSADSHTIKPAQNYKWIKCYQRCRIPLHTSSTGTRHSSHSVCPHMENKPWCLLSCRSDLDRTDGSQCLTWQTDRQTDAVIVRTNECGGVTRWKSQMKTPTGSNLLHIWGRRFSGPYLLNPLW